MYAGLVKAGETWYDVTTGGPAQWASWDTAASDESYSDCAKLDINTGQFKIRCKAGLFQSKLKGWTLDKVVHNDL